MSAEREGASSMVVWCLVVVAVPVLYLLTLPPMVVVVYRITGKDAVTQFPLGRLDARPWEWIRANTPLGDILNDYARWWLQKTGILPPPPPL